MTLAPSATEPSTKWETSLLRATAFYTTTLELGAVKWWETLTGHPAESRTHRPGMGQLVEVGTVDTKLLQLQIQPGRVDWVLGPKDPSESDKFLSLGDFGESSNYFRDLIFKWLEQAPALNRIAFGAVLSIPTRTEAESVETLSRLLPYFRIEWRGLSNVIFQANRPRPCITIPQLGEINRLARWQTVVRKMFVATIAVQAQAATTTAEEPAAQCELDISSAVQVDPTMTLPPAQLKALFAELVQHATDIVAKGNLL